MIKTNQKDLAVMFEVNTFGVMHTNSPIKAWYLAAFRGQRVVCRWKRPLFSCALFTLYMVRFELAPCSTF